MSSRKIKIVGSGELSLPAKSYLTKGKEYTVVQGEGFVVWIQDDERDLICVLVGESRGCAHIAGYSYSSLYWEDVV